MHTAQVDTGITYTLPSIWYQGIHRTSDFCRNSFAITHTLQTEGSGWKSEMKYTNIIRVL